MSEFEEIFAPAMSDSLENIGKQLKRIADILESREKDRLADIEREERLREWKERRNY